MNANPTTSPRRSCARQFAQHLIQLDELQEWEERKWLVLDLGKVSDFLDSTGQWKSNWQSERLPDLGRAAYNWKSDDDADEAIARVASWVFEVMSLLNMEPPVDWRDPESSPIEGVQAMVDAISHAAIPMDLDWR